MNIFNTNSQKPISKCILNGVNDIDKSQLKEIIVKNEKLINQQHPSEKYRKDFFQKGHIFSKEGFISVNVKQSYFNRFISLHTYITYPISYPKGVVFMFHGLGSYTNVSVHVANEYSQKGLISIGYDLRGHGKSEGINGNIEDIDEVLNDTEYVIKTSILFLEEKYNENKAFLNNVFLSGVSFGGLLAYLFSQRIDNNESYLKKNMLKGVILYAPAFSLNISSLMRVIISIVNCIYSNYSIHISQTESDICKNPLIFEKPDPIVHNTIIKIGSINEILNATNKLSPQAFHYSFIIICPAIDKLCKPSGMFDFFKNSISNDKTFVYYENLWHQVYNEEEIYNVLYLVNDWIRERLG